ncbi:hypothetical protein Hanom_Chr01g00051701 [Helianthus anomalus]
MRIRSRRIFQISFVRRVLSHCSCNYRRVIISSTHIGWQRWRIQEHRCIR